MVDCLVVETVCWMAELTVGLSVVVMVEMMAGCLVVQMVGCSAELSDSS